MVVGSADTLTTLSNNLHSRLIMIYVEPCCNISLCSTPSSQHWNVQFLEMIPTQILNLSYRAISQDNTFISYETTRVSNQKYVLVAPDVDSVRELFCCSSEEEVEYSFLHVLVAVDRWGETHDEFSLNPWIL